MTADPFAGCDCARRFLTRVGRCNEYARAKTLLNQGRHPAFIGRSTYDRCARDGGALFFTVGTTDVAVALVNAKNSTLLALNVHPEHRGHGLGAAVIQFLRPNFARVIDTKVDWFTTRGYLPVGAPKQGRTHQTQVMVRSELRELSGRVSQLVGDRCRCSEQAKLPAARDRVSERDNVTELPVPHAGHRPHVAAV